MKLKKNSIVWLCGAGAVILAGAVLLLLLPKQEEETKPKEIELLIGTYGNHLYRYSFHKETLEFTQIDKAESANPSYVLKDNDTIYAVKEIGDSSALMLFNEDLERIAEPVETGSGPCFVMVDEEFIYTADYDGGSMSIVPKDGGEVQIMNFSGTGPVEGRQESSHIHQIKQLPRKAGWLLASDLGADKIRLINKEEGFKHIADIDCPPGTGPRHMVFSANGRYLYCLGELSGMVLVYRVNYLGKTPKFKLIQEYKADGFNAAGSADIHIHPSGEYLYTSHRLYNDGISIFVINDNGKIVKKGYLNTPKHPRNFMITPDGDFLIAAFRDDKLIKAYQINIHGVPKPTRAELPFENDMPSSVTAW